MPEGWPNIALEEVADLSGGYAFKSDEYAVLNFELYRRLSGVDIHLLANSSEFHRFDIVCAYTFS